MPTVVPVRAAFCGLLMLAALAACADEAIAPQPTRYFYLVSIGGVPIPVRTEASLPETTFVLGGSIGLDQLGRASRRTTQQRVVNGVRLAPETLTDTAQYEQRGDHIVVGIFHCAGPVACPHGDEGTISDDRLVLTPQVSPPPPAWEYRRALLVDVVAGLGR